MLQLGLGGSDQEKQVVTWMCLNDGLARNDTLSCHAAQVLAGCQAGPGAAIE